MSADIWTSLSRFTHDGPMSNHIHGLEIGDVLSCKGPIPTYPWSASKHKDVVFLAGGTGITPMYQLIRKIFNDPQDKTKVVLLFGNISQDDIVLRDELETIRNQNSNSFKIVHILDKSATERTFETGYIRTEMLRATLPAPGQKDLKIFVCGPAGMYQSISGMKSGPQAQGKLTGILADLGYSENEVHKF